jgi:hypothetical protein
VISNATMSKTMRPLSMQNPYTGDDTGFETAKPVGD